jgi:hypothetical protein
MLVGGGGMGVGQGGGCITILHGAMATLQTLPGCVVCGIISERMDAGWGGGGEGELVRGLRRLHIYITSKFFAMNDFFSGNNTMNLLFTVFKGISTSGAGI